MLEIESHLKNIRTTDDLSYSQQQDNIVELNGRKVLDEETLLRLLDDCQEEEAKLSIM